MAGGQAYVDPCPAGQLVIGYSGKLAAQGWHGQIQAMCGTPSITGSGPYTITITPAATTPLRGLLGSTPWTSACPANQAVIGFEGRAGALIDALALHCAPLTIQGSSVLVGAETILTAVGDLGGNAFGVALCGAGEVATVSNLRAGDNLDAFGLGCSTVGLTF